MEIKKHLKKIRKTTSITHTKLFKYTQKIPHFKWITIIILTIVVGVTIFNSILTHINNDRYKLAPSIAKALGSVDTALLKKVQYNHKNGTYNLAGVVSSNTNQKVAVGSSANQPGYSFRLPTRLSNGITITDPVSQLSIGLTPKTASASGSEVAGHYIYPLTNGAQDIFSVKANGLQEDIALPHGLTHSQSFSYNINLPNTLQARKSSSGYIGIYSATPSLFGNISYGSSKDQQLVALARQKSAKNNLVFALPAPILELADQPGLPSPSSKDVQAYYELTGNLLTLVVHVDHNINSPMIIDPSIIVTSVSDFTSSGNNEGDITYNSTNNSISEAGLRGGSVSTGWTATTSLPIATDNATSVAYNGYIYELGGNNGTVSTVDYAPVNSNGTITTGSWTAATSLPTGTYQATSVAYDGYLYEIGGYTNATGLATATVDYAPINSNGSLGSWTATTSLPTATMEATSVAYDGYLYEIGGNNASFVALSTVDYAPINSNGTLGSWTATTTMPATIYQSTSVAYNGYVYEISGASGAGTSVYYSPVNSNGTIGSWTTTTSLPTATHSATSVAYNGYVYEIGGCSGSCPTATVDYAPINSDGTLGSWTATTSLPTATDGATSVAYNGYVYEIGGYTGTNTAVVDYAPIDPAGVTGTWTTNSGSTYGSWPSNGSANDDIDTVAFEPQATPNIALQQVASASMASNSVQTITLSSSVVAGDTLVLETGIYSSANVISVSGGGVTWLLAATYNDCIDSRPCDAGDLETWYGLNSSGTSGATTVTITYSASISGGGPNGMAISDWSGISSLDTGVSGYTTNGSLPKSTPPISPATQGELVMAAIDFNNSSSPVASPYTAMTIPGDNAVAYYIDPNTTGFTTARQGLSTVATNGYLYIMGGKDSTPATLNDVQYAPINSNGTIGSWTATTSFTTARDYLGAVAYNGYLYIMGGYSGSTEMNDVQYAPINSNGTIGSWSATTSFTTARSDFGAVAYNGYLYIMGGWNGSTEVNDVQYAPINSNGTIGSWTATTSFPTVRADFGAVAYGGYLYIMGGYSGSTEMNDVQYAPINSNGTIGSWTATTSFTTAREDFSVVVDNGYLYIMGGDNGGSTYYNDVQYAPINSNGTIGSWTTTTNLSTGRADFAAVAYNGYLYITGGYDGTNVYNDTQYAQINNGGPGTTSSWTATTSLPTQTFAATSVAYNGYVYEIGGEINGYSGTATATVDYAPINSNGTIGSWTATTSLPAAMEQATSVVYDGYLYEMGGQTSGFSVSSGFSSVVDYAPINSNGTLGSWTATTSLPVTTEDATSVVYNGYVYEMGGYNGSSNTAVVDYAPINSNGTIGTWTATTSLPATNTGSTSVVYNGYVYEIGGYEYSNNASVDYAPINSNGTLGSWTATTSLPLATWSATSLVYNGFIYLMGGQTNSGYPTSVYYAPINNNGTLGPWSNTTAFPTSSTTLATSVVYNGYVYEIGGNNTNVILIAGLQSIPRIGVYSRLVDLTGGSTNDPNPIKLLSNGTNTGNPGIGGISGPGGINVSYGLSSNSCSSISVPNPLATGISNQLATPFTFNFATTDCSAATNIGRYVWIKYELDDSQTASFPDISGNHTTINDFTIYYNPASSNRLRGGATFSNGTPQSLDATP